jgi:cytochrome c-type biogenesis protein CcmF
MPTRLPSRRLLALLGLLALVAGSPVARAQDAPVVDVQPDDPGHTSGAASEIYRAPAVAQRLFADIVCMCGDCKRLTLKACGCPNAVAERAKIMGMLAGKDLSSHEKEQKVYEEIRDSFIKEYGGQHVLTVPLDKGFNKLGWMVPWAVFVLALGMVFVVGRRWVLRGRAVTAARSASGGSGTNDPKKSRADEEREDRLDDELRDLD